VISVIANVGYKGTYKMVYCDNIRESLVQLGIPDEALSINRSNKQKYIKLATKALTVIQIALMALDFDSITSFAAGPTHDIDIAPLETGAMDIYWLMLKAILYISIPVFAWVGYIFAFAGSNGGKRTAAKVVLFSLIGGIAFVAGAPWMAKLVYAFCRSVFHV
jgi:hypothetical protein